MQVNPASWGQSVRSDYLTLFKKARLIPECRGSVEKVVTQMVERSAAYERVSEALGIPWWCIGAIHRLESGASFNGHLHNGDPLASRTVHVPKARPTAPPAAGEGKPYTWDESAIDALRGRWRPKSWALDECLSFLEHYNGMGYWLREINSPYVWGSTSVYEGGYFTKDGSFSPTAISRQVGGAAMLKILMERGAVAFNGV